MRGLEAAALAVSPFEAPGAYDTSCPNPLAGTAAWGGLDEIGRCEQLGQLALVVVVVLVAIGSVLVLLGPPRATPVDALVTEGVVTP